MGYITLKHWKSSSIWFRKYIMLLLPMRSYLQGNTNLSSSDCLCTDTLGIQQYVFDSLLFPRVVQDKYILLFKELITQLRSYVSAIRVLAKGYLPTTLITPSKLQEILAEVNKSLQHTNPDCALVFRKTTFIL